MSKRKGDESKKPVECRDNWTKCPNIKLTYQGWGSETYECDVCGERFKLYYEDMQ